MIGSLTHQVGQVVDEYLVAFGSAFAKAVVSEGVMTGKIEFVAPLFSAAHAVRDGETVHPRVLWGSFWFLYYQAWLWRYSVRYREWFVEVNLKRLQDMGGLEQLLAYYRKRSKEGVCVQRLTNP